MRKFAVLCLVLGLGGAALAYPADTWYLYIYEPENNAVYVEPIVITPRGAVAGGATNNTKQVVAEAEFWFEPEGQPAVKVDSTSWTAKAGESTGFNFGQSPQLSAGKGWVGVRVLDADGKIIDYKIHNFVVNKALAPPPPPPPAASR